MIRAENSSSSRRIPASLLVIGLAYVAFVSLGLPDGLNGVAWPFVRATFHLPLDALGTLLVMFTLGFLLSSVSSGRLLAHLSVGTLLGLSCMLLAISLGGYALAPRWFWMVLLAALAGAGAGAIDAGLNTYAATNFNLRTVNWLHACYGVGAAMGPVIMTRALNSGSRGPENWRWGYGAVGAGQLVLAAAFMLTRHLWKASRPNGLAEIRRPAASNSSTLRLHVVWLSAAVFFVYTGVEVAAGTWAFSLFTEGRGIPAAVAGLWVSVYWASLTVGRLAFGFVAESAARSLLRLCLIGTAAGASLVWLNPSSTWSFFGLAVMGFAAGPIFPSMIAATPRRVGDAHTPNAIGLQIAAAVLGQSLLPAAIGVAARHLGLEAIGPALFLAALVLVALYELLRTTGSFVVRDPTDIPSK